MASESFAESKVLKPSLKVNVDPTPASTPMGEKYRHTINSLNHTLWSQLPSPVPPPPVYQPEQASKIEQVMDTSITPSSTSVNSGIHGAHTLVDSESTSTIEKGEGPYWEGYENDPIPDKTQNKVIRNLRHQIFTLYRRLFGVVFIVNVSILVATMARGGANAQQIGLIVVSNLFCAILMRQDYVINVFFNVFCSVPAS